MPAALDDEDEPITQATLNQVLRGVRRLEEAFERQRSELVDVRIEAARLSTTVQGLRADVTAIGGTELRANYAALQSRVEGAEAQLKATAVQRWQVLLAVITAALSLGASLLTAMLHK